ncbi:hypothetical protein [Sedimentibacter sp. B4]|uniref:hypothetical protein n=1 Tax=Sedimentibacter sp. B4 TaxID=304766 RepID=UPI0002E6EE5E|nr:hypothetical protein [Sedimentibacter sp. B4]
MHQKRLDNTELNKENNRKVIKLEVDIEKMNKDLDEIKLAIERGMASIKEFKEINKKITFAKSAYSIISDIELEMMNEVREKMRCESESTYSFCSGFHDLKTLNSSIFLSHPVADSFIEPLNDTISSSLSVKIPTFW